MLVRLMLRHVRATCPARSTLFTFLSPARCRDGRVVDCFKLRAKLAQLHLMLAPVRVVTARANYM